MLRSLLALVLFCLALPSLAQTDDSLARVKARGVLKIATDATYPPFEFMEASKVVGFDAELAAELGRELGVDVEMVSMEWSGVFAAVETGKCDLVMSGVTITSERMTYQSQQGKEQNRAERGTQTKNSCEKKVAFQRKDSVRLPVNFRGKM